ncbi:TPA: XapX domain-containing protein [Enterobacter sichuanensis]|nr:XapX domain-containing protein [Enterobacter sichuanensis]HDT1605540.1 XapX domain-containing protein [Enterobacter sichuanensis]
MSTGLISLAAGVLIGLLGMLAGEQATRHLLSRDGAPPPQVTVVQAASQTGASS